MKVFIERIAFCIYFFGFSILIRQLWIFCFSYFVVCIPMYLVVLLHVSFSKLFFSIMLKISATIHFFLDIFFLYPSIFQRHCFLPLVLFYIWHWPFYIFIFIIVVIEFDVLVQFVFQDRTLF